MADTGNTVVLPRGVKTARRSQSLSDQYPKGSQLPSAQQITEVVGQTVRSYRATGRIVEAIRLLTRIDGTVSTAIFDLVEVANSGLSVKAYQSSNHQFSPGAAQLARSLLSAMDTLYDYSGGYADQDPIATLIETALLESAITGACCAELVLNKQRLPQRLHVVPFDWLRWKSKGKGGKYPVQVNTGREVDLNVPTFWVSTTHKQATTAYPNSLYEASLATSVYYQEFVEDMRRAVRRGGHSRLHVKLNAEKVIASAPADKRDDPVALTAYMAKVQSDVESVVRALEPEDAIVAYDFVEVDTVGADREKTDYKELLQALSGLLATSLKTHPSILGLRLDGSQSLSNTESLVYLKICRSIQRPVATIMSRALTLAVRLYGVDAYVKVDFKSINLRPDDELEAFKLMHQDRILELLSLGFLTDDEAAEMLETGPRGPDAPELSGTMFHSKKMDTTNASPNADPMGRALQPSTPAKGGGKSQ